MANDYGWKKYSMLESHGRSMALPICGGCQFYQFKKDFSGDTPHICKGPSTDCEGHHRADGNPPRENCGGYKPKAGEESAPAGSGGAGIVKGLKTMWDTFDGDNVSGTVAGLAKGTAQIIAGVLVGVGKAMKDEARQVVVNAQKAVESAEFSDTKKTAKTVNGLFTTYGTLMQPLFKEFADAQRAVAGAVLDVIENGIGILREDAGFDRAKLDKLRIKLQESRVQWAGIKTTGEQMGETIKSGFSSAFGGGDGTGAPIETEKRRILVSCVSFDGGEKLVTWGVDELFKIEKFLFSFLGAGKAMFSTQKRELSGAAIQKIEEGIAALKKLGYDARKIAGYEANLAKFRKERDNIKKTKQEERIDSVRGGLGDIVKGAGGLFGKK